MSVATEFPPAVFIPVRARQLPRAAALTRPANQPRLWLVPPVDRCAPASRGRVIGPRRGAGRVTRPPVQLAQPAGMPVGLDAEGVGQLQARPVRLTRRGMVVVALGVAAVGGLLLLLAHLSASSPAARPAGVPGGVVTVRQGDTLWSIAGQVAPGRDPRQVVERIRRSNHLTSVSLTPGQTLKVG
ncbi:MAG: LysM peptidoglycan-binding domain-containing protein [Jatrophihabitantaceae bacterium]